MKRTLILSTATALVLGFGFAVPASAGGSVFDPETCNLNGNANWSHDKLQQKVINRHGDKGKGNGGEKFFAASVRLVVCEKNDPDGEDGDIDPRTTVLGPPP